MYAHNDFFSFLIVTFVKTTGIPTSVQKGGGGGLELWAKCYINIKKKIKILSREKT
jgi:hypothetical protein